ncbi:uncharacterized protein LOC124276147 [Haliotis rubra]|uniref:uncharacterized protein LOC124276147 n=1 Tax=Haliotis rubra TaxID=36100 RepID=UPI001EE5CA60|nr:uncharacterized protein LOC124276147 [Haliotis rubra]
MPSNYPTLRNGFSMATSVNFTVDGTMRFGTNTKILSTTPFDFDGEVIESYYNPPIMTITEALSAPVNTRLSIIGKVIQSYPRSTTGVRKKSHPFDTGRGTDHS